MQLPATSGTAGPPGTGQSAAAVAAGGKTTSVPSALSFLELFFRQANPPQTPESNTKPGAKLAGEILLPKGGMPSHFQRNSVASGSTESASSSPTAKPAAKPTKREPARLSVGSTSLVAPYPVPVSAEPVVHPAIPQSPAVVKSSLITQQASEPGTAHRRTAAAGDVVAPASTASPSIVASCHDEAQLHATAAAPVLSTKMTTSEIAQVASAMPQKDGPQTSSSNRTPVAGSDLTPPLNAFATVKDPGPSQNATLTVPSPVEQPSIGLATTQAQGATSASKPKASSLVQKSTIKSSTSAMKTEVAPLAGPAVPLHQRTQATLIAPVEVVHASSLHVQPASASAGLTTAVSVHPAQTFEHMDGARMPVTLLSSPPHEVSVAVSDPLHGYMEIKTHAEAGSISASLAASTPEAHASLLSHVPALGEYLSGHGVQVGNVSVERNLTAMSGGSQHGGGQPPPQGQHQPQTPQAPASMGRATLAEIPAIGEQPESSAIYSSRMSSISIRV